MKSRHVFSLFALLFATLVSNSASAIQEAHPLDKSSTETWTKYISRLFDAGEISQADLNRWNQGGELSLAKNMTVTRTRLETRFRMVPVTRTRTVTNDDGVEVQEPYVESVQQNYTVSVPYTERLSFIVTIPARNSRPDTATLSEFSKNTPPKQLASMNSPNAQPPIATTIETKQAESRKLSSENWDTYVERLVNQGLLNTKQLKAWKSGRDVKIETRKSFTMMRTETRTRTVPVTRSRFEKQGDKEVETEYTEVVAQNYTVMVPVTSSHDISLTLPGRGKRRANATHGGFSLAGSANLQNEPTKYKKIPPKLLEIMKVKPKQQDVVYTETRKYNKLSIQKVDEDSITGWEVVSDRNEPLRRFLDFNGDDKLDNWIFFKNGKETYREVDFDFDGKVDQYQYTKGNAVRYGTDENQDGTIDRWTK